MKDQLQETTKKGLMKLHTVSFSERMKWVFADMTLYVLQTLGGEIATRRDRRARGEPFDAGFPQGGIINQFNKTNFIRFIYLKKYFQNGLKINAKLRSHLV